MNTPDKMEIYKAQQVEKQRQHILREIAKKHKLAVLHCIEAAQKIKQPNS